MVYHNSTNYKNCYLEVAHFFRHTQWKRVDSFFRHGASLATEGEATVSVQGASDLVATTSE